jgi:hypothetical protein
MTFFLKENDQIFPFHFYFSHLQKNSCLARIFSGYLGLARIPQKLVIHFNSKLIRPSM